MEEYNQRNFTGIHCAIRTVYDVKSEEKSNQELEYSWGEETKEEEKEEAEDDREDPEEGLEGRKVLPMIHDDEVFICFVLFVLFCFVFCFLFFLISVLGRNFKNGKKLDYSNTVECWETITCTNSKVCKYIIIALKKKQHQFLKHIHPLLSFQRCHS